MPFHFPWMSFFYNIYAKLKMLPPWSFPENRTKRFFQPNNGKAFSQPVVFLPAPLCSPSSPHLLHLFQKFLGFQHQKHFFARKKKHTHSWRVHVKKSNAQKITSQKQHKKRTIHNFLTVLHMVLSCPSAISLQFYFPEQLDFGVNFINIQFLFTD